MGDKSCSGPPEDFGCCSFEAVVNIDDRGQMVLPKDLRERAGIQPGDKLVLVSCVKDDKVCCITMLRADDMQDVVKSMIGPMMKGVVE